MTIAYFPATEAQIRMITEALKKAGLFDRYEEQARGANILISVRTKDFEEREIVKAIFAEAGINDFFYLDEHAA
jgi:hypothetical protein